jgi:hypothetical protein
VKPRFHHSNHYKKLEDVELSPIDPILVSVPNRDRLSLCRFA